MIVYFFELVLVFLTFFIIFGRKSINMLNPTILYCIIWGTMIVLYVLPIFLNYPTIKFTNWLLIISTVLVFCLGSELAIVTFRNRKAGVSFSYDKKKLQSLMFLLLMIVFVAFVITVVKLGLPPLLGGSIVRSLYYVNFVEPFYLLIFPFWFGSVYLIKSKYHIYRNVFFITVSLIPVLMRGNKFPLIFLIGLIIFYLGINKKVKLKYLFLILFVVFGVFIFSSTFITKSSDEILKTQDVILGINLPSYLRSLADPIMYITNNLMNFSNFLNVHSPYSFGMEQISGLMHDLGLDFLVRNSVNANSMLWSSNLQFSWLTTGTYLKTFYLDFGYIGVIFGPLFYGYICGYFYMKVIKKQMDNSLTTIYISYLLFLSVLLSFFTNYFSENGLIYNLIVIFIIDFVTRRRSLDGSK